MSYVRTAEIRNKTSKTHKRLGIHPPNQTGFKHSKDAKRKISLALSGERHYRWVGGRFIKCMMCDKKQVSRYSATKMCSYCYKKERLRNRKIVLRNKNYNWIGKNNPGYIDGRWNPISNRKRLLKSSTHKQLSNIVQRVYEDNIKKHGTLTCFYCQNEIKFGYDTLDHKVPRSRGGSDNYSNLVIACFSCNSGKKNKTSSEYFKYLSKGAQ